MYTDNGNFTGKDGHVPLDMGDPNKLVQNFRAEIEKLQQYVPLAYRLFTWHNPDSNPLITLLYLGDMLYMSLVSIKRLHTMRTKYILDEQCIVFENIVKEIKSLYGVVDKFIDEAEWKLKDALQENDALCAEYQKQKDKFRDIIPWFCETEKEEWLQEIISHDFERLNIDYQLHKKMTNSDGFRQQAYIVFFGLVLLSIPAYYRASKDSIVQLYHNTLDMFWYSEPCKEEMRQLNEQLEDEMLLSHKQSRRERIEFLTKKKLQIKEDIKNYIESFGIIHNMANEKMFAESIYIQTNAEAYRHSKKMSGTDLQKYLFKKAMLRYVEQEIASMKALDTEAVNLPDPEGFFTNDVPLNRMRNALESTVKERRGDNGFVLCAQAHWFAVFKVLETKGLCQGTMRQFADLMNNEAWFKTADTPCVYKSMKSVPSIDAKFKSYPNWDTMHDKRNRPYKDVADTFIRFLEENDVI